MISISHSPNSDWKQQLKALSYIILPWKWLTWKKGSSISRLESALSKMHNNYPAISFSSGREALYSILKALEIEDGDEVIIQAYTCIVVPNSIIWAGAKPVYADIDESLNLNPDSVERLITNNTRAIIVQHAFGNPADLRRIKDICSKNNIYLIEDCALSLGAKYNGNYVGTFGDASVFSFGRDKIISSVSGGMVVVKNQILSKKIRKIADASHQRPRLWIFQNLMHPLLVPWMSRLTGKLKVGQIFLLLSQKIGLLNKVYTKKERYSEKPAKITYRLPNSMAALGLSQFNNLGVLASKRKEISKQLARFCEENEITHQKITSNSDPAYLRFPIFTDQPKKLIAHAKRAGFIIGDWYNEVVVPNPKEWSQIYYTPGSCPRAEKYSSSSVNLPTHRKIKSRHIKKLKVILKEHYG